MSAGLTQAGSSEDTSCSKFSLKNALLLMYKKQLHTDVNIQVRWNGNMTCFKAHRLMLAMRSPVFADEFRGKQLFSLVTFVVEGVKPRIIEVLLWYIYSGSLISGTIEEIIGVAKVAKYYQIGGVKEACKQILFLYVPDKHNVCSLLDASICFEMKLLRKKCVEIVKKHHKSILTSSGFLKASHDTVSIILEQTSPSVSRNQSMEAVLRWLQRNRQADRSLLSNFNIASLSSSDFLDLMEKFPSFLKAKEAISILSNMLRPGRVDLPPWYSRTSEEGQTYLPVSISAAEIVDRSLRLETACDKRIGKSSLYGKDGFEGSVTVMLRQFKDLALQLNLPMLELAFGSSFIPEDTLKIEIFSYLQEFTTTKKKRMKFSLQATPENYYVILNDKIVLHRNYPFIFSFRVEVKGLKRWRTNGLVSDDQYRVMQVPENIPFNNHLTGEGIPSVHLTSMSDWLVFVDPATGEKHFPFTALYFDSDSSQE